MLCTSSSQGMSITVPSADYNRPVEYHQPAHYSGFAYQQGRAEEFLQDQAVHSSLNYAVVHHPTSSKNFWEPPPQQQVPPPQLKVTGSVKASAETGSKPTGHSRWYLYLLVIIWIASERSTFILWITLMEKPNKRFLTCRFHLWWKTWNTYLSTHW